MKSHIYCLSLLLVMSALHAAAPKENISPIESTSADIVFLNILNSLSNKDLISLANSSHRLRNVVFKKHPRLMWAISPYHEMTIPNAHTGSIHSVYVSNDGNIITVGATDGMINIWNGKTLKKIKKIAINGQCLLTAFSTSSNVLVVFHENSTPVLQPWKITALNIKSGKKIKEFEMPQVAFSLAVSSEGKMIATGHQRNLILWDMLSNTSKNIRLNGCPFSLSFSPSNKSIAGTLRPSSIVNVWNVETLVLEEQYKIPNEETRVSFFPNGQLIADSQGLSDNFWHINVRDVRTDAQLGSMTFNGFNGIDIRSLTHDGALVGLCYRDNPLILDAKTGKIVRQFNSVNKKISVITFSPDERLFIAGCADGSAIIWKRDINIS